MDNIYKLWLRIKKRCYYKKYRNYKNYGGRGIILSEEFHDFYRFRDYVITLPNYENWESHYTFKKPYKNPLSIDRINNNGNYERDNLKWSTVKEQANNRRSSKVTNGISLYKFGLKRGYNKIYRARIRVNGRYINLGYHETIEKASLVIEQYQKVNSTIII